MLDRPPSNQAARQVDDRLLHLIYALYIAVYLFAVTGIAGVILAYMLRGQDPSDRQRSHLDWQIRTFWWQLLFAVIALIVPFLLGFLIAILVWGAMITWYVYRIVKGWYRLWQGQPIEDPHAFV